MMSNESPVRINNSGDGIDESLDQQNLSIRLKVGSGDEMPVMPTMSMRAAQHDLKLEREKFNN